MSGPSPRPTQAITSEEELLFSFVGTLPWPVILIRNDGEVIHVTREIAGRKDTLNIGRQSSLETLFPEYFSALQGSARWLIAQEAELTRRLPDGGAVHEHIVLRCLPAGSYLIVVDQSKLRTLETSNVQTARLAALGFMVAGVCHEMSNPLTSLHSMVQILKSDKMAEPNPREKGLSNVAANVKRLMDISGRLLNFARVGDEPRSGFRVDAPIEEAFAVIKQDHRAEHLDCEYVPDPRAVIFGSSRQLQEVFVNIFENALQAMDGIGKLSVKTERKDGGRVVVTIRDTGPGIPCEAMPRLFEPFFTTKAPGSGTGLGLVISDEIVREHDGLIMAENNADTGACFRIEFPLYGGLS